MSGRTASFVAPGPGAEPLSLYVAHADGRSRERVGEPARFEIVEAGEAARWTLRVTPTDCVRALERLRVGAGLAAGMRVLATSSCNPAPGTAGHQDQSAAHRIVDTLAGLGADELRAVMREEPAS